MLNMSDRILEKYDIAISYVASDQELASKISAELGQSLKVFIYTDFQEKLGGSAGVETLRKIFTKRTNIIVILHREKWGHTDWTNTEEHAIKDFGLKNRWKRIVLIKLDKSQIPEWYPENMIYLDYEQYGFEELIGVLKSKAQEMGSIIKPITALEKAKILGKERIFTQKKESILKSKEGLQRASKEVEILFDKLDGICNEITSTTTVNFLYEKVGMQTYSLKGYKQTNGISFGLGVRVIWCPSSLEKLELIVMKVDIGRPVYRDDPVIFEEILFDFDLSPSFENCWKDKDSNKVYSTDLLAEYIVQIIMDFKRTEV